VPEIYPIPMFPSFLVRDLEASKRYYLDALGFELIYELPGRFVHLRRAKYQDLMLAPAAPGSLPEEGDAGRGVNLWLALEGDVDAFAEAARAAGADIVEGPVDRPWNIRDVVFRDPDGYRIALGGLKPGPLPSFEETMARLSDE
jgi:catechol 2,3-dioxygenase-like lactoylglutathione lyase family enzyme